MATRSTIAVVHGDGTVSQIYSHWDGYPSHNGMILKNNYNSLELAEKLVSGGDISVLDISVDKPEGHSFDNRIEGYTTYYGRDRGEQNTEAKKFDNMEMFYLTCQEEEYDYVFIDGEWKLKIGKNLVDYTENSH